ncbi:MAG TPA: M20/M25/M40 family metallo-hydrolase [Longimicrobiales bacterium]|nr:M20/M25/M40 family metallo-hydrolase [Longimicrobiales bacterium]
MRKSIILQLLTASVLAGAVTPDLFGQDCPDPVKLTAGHSGPIATVRYLADDALGGRLAGTSGERCAGDFIAHRFAALKLKPAGANGTYFQEFSVASAANPHAAPGTARNVLALLEGGDPQLQNELVIVGAHYDHLGEGAFGSTSVDKKPAIHNGADDNASGVAALLEIAERMTRGEKPARSILFMAFSAEEQGLLGSNYFTNNPTVALANARAMINLDMVGRLAQGPLIVYGIGTAQEWEKLVNAAAEREQVTVTLNPDGYGASDHTSFYLKDIPVLHLFTNVHSDYHNPGDDWEKIDAAGLKKVSNIVIALAAQVANPQTVITLQKGAGRPPSQAGGGGYGAYLGTVPDFSPVEYGVKISGVRDGSPAALAGLKAGDVIIRFDDVEVGSLQAMTNELRKRKPDEPVKITVLREGKEVVLPATFGKR